MGYLKVILAILIWSSLGIFVRKIGLPITNIVFYPVLFAALLQFFILYKTGGLSSQGVLMRGMKSPSCIFKAPAPILYLLALCSLTNTLLYYYAFTHTTIANAVLTHYTAPIFVALTAPLLLKEKSHRIVWLAIIFSSIGLWLMLGGLSVRSEEFKGIIAGTASGLAYAIIILLLRIIMRTHSTLFIVFIQNLIITFILLPFVINTSIPFSSLPYLILMGLIHSTLAPLLYVDGFKSVKANEAAVIGYIEPLGAIILALIFLGEVPHFKALLGGVLILYSGFMVLKSRQS